MESFKKAVVKSMKSFPVIYIYIYKSMIPVKLNTSMDGNKQKSMRSQ